jgi:hypothetical protein
MLQNCIVLDSTKINKDHLLIIKSNDDYSDDSDNEHIRMFKYVMFEVKYNEMKSAIADYVSMFPDLEIIFDATNLNTTTLFKKIKSKLKSKIIIKNKYVALKNKYTECNLLKDVKEICNDMYANKANN